MNITLGNLIGNGVFVYMDDVVIYAKTLEEHERHFDIVLDKFKEANWKIEPEKCELLKHEVVYLGHILSKDGLRPYPKKIKAVKDFPRPKNVSNIRQFLGLAGYYRKFIKDFAKIAKPLSKLTEKDTPFEWTDTVYTSFNTLKEALCTAPVLKFLDMNKPFVITTDAPGYAVGGILSQGKIGNDRPVAYTSRVLRGPELRYDAYEKEALAIIHSVKTFRPYIYGSKFTIVTDQKPLIWFKTAEVNTSVQKWRFQLSEYDYDVIYIGSSFRF